MVKRDALHVVLVVRRHKEHVEERRLASISHEVAKARLQLESVTTELHQITAARMSQVGMVYTGRDLQEIEAAIAALAQQRVEAAGRIRALEQERLEQMSSYLSARCDRDVIEQAHGRREALHDALARAREQKSIDELFLTRRVLDSDTSGSRMS